MKRINNQTSKNSPAEYDKIFEWRSYEGVDSGDLRRWKMLLKYFKGGKILDVGCLDSMVYDLAKMKYFGECKYLGIDLAKECVNKMSARYRADGAVKFEVRDAYKTGLSDGFFDYVIMGEILEHLDDPLGVIKEGLRVLRSGGTLAVSTPHDEAREIGAVDPHRHLWSFTIKDMVEILRPFGRVKTKILGSEHFPQYKYHFPTLITWVKKK